MNLGLVYLALNQEDDAMKYLRRAAELAPNSAEAWSNYGAILDIKGKLSEAESAYKQSLELDGTNNATIVNLGMNLLQQDRPSEAISVFQQAIKNDPASPVLHKRYGDALMAAKQYDEAIVEYNTALAKNPRFTAALNEKASALVRKYQKGLELDDELLRSALEAWRQSLLINPKQPRVQANIQKWQTGKTIGR